jgi:hypothetical protein
MRCIFLGPMQGCQMVQTKNPNFGKNFQGLRLGNVDIFYGDLEYFIDIWDFL